MQQCVLGPAGWKTVFRKRPGESGKKQAKEEPKMCPHDIAKESLAVIRSAAKKKREVILSQYSSAGLLSTREKWSKRRGLREELQRG